MIIDTLTVEVLFYRDKRKIFPALNKQLDGTSYQPHFAVKGSDEYLGVEFIESSLNRFNLNGKATVKLLYKNIDYSKLTSGSEFTIFEGSNAVGEGRVL